MFIFNPSVVDSNYSLMENFISTPLSFENTQQTRDKTGLWGYSKSAYRESIDGVSISRSPCTFYGTKNFFNFCTNFLELCFDDYK